MGNYTRAFSFKSMILGMVMVGMQATSQTSTANDSIPAYPSRFSYGVTSSYYTGLDGGNATVRNIADLAKRAKVRGIRQIVLDQFMDTYAPNYELNNFKYFRATDSITNISIYLSTPSPVHRATDSITCTVNGSIVKYRSESFANLYAPIWDDSLDGRTPINDQNYYARYVFNLVKSYKDYVKVYEVWNAPDLSNSLNADRLKGDPGNWWDHNPQPCDLVNLHAPFIDYVRMLRITYEIVKSVDSSALVALGGITRENFLDAVLRNTDNPNGGLVTAAYPLKGGAYFDVVAYQSQPQYTLKEWDEKLKVFKYFRHSDAAAQKVKDTKTKFSALLRKYGYNDTLYPQKHFVVSKVNIPRKQYFDRDFIGSVDAQRNFIAKLYVVAQKSNLKYVHLHTIGDTRTETESTSELEGNDLMGLYYNLNAATTQTATLNQSGIAAKTMAQVLEAYNYDSTLTSKLNLNATVDGAVFVNGEDTLLTLWAKTNTDLSEAVEVTYTIPPLFAGNTSLMEIYKWDYAATGQIEYSSGNRLHLTAAPIITRLKIYTGLNDESRTIPVFHVWPNPSKGVFHVQREKQYASTATLHVMDVMGRQVHQSALVDNHTQLEVPHLKAGIYQLVFKDEQGTSSLKLLVE
ncbi:MAG TPA: T9SS type A sorting domain-containing protein [Cytophagales bacterium]|nr:T9SS type A sorting domain-containing protein [Cytophagales bacterium]